MRRLLFLLPLVLLFIGCKEKHYLRALSAGKPISPISYLKMKVSGILQWYAMSFMQGRIPRPAIK